MKSVKNHLSLVLSVLITSTVLVGAESNIFKTITQKVNTGFVTLRDIPGINTLSLPQPLQPFLSALVIENPVLEQYELGFSLSGTVVIQGVRVPVRATIYAGLDKLLDKKGAVKPTSSVEAKLTISLPTTIQFAKLAPELGVFDDAVQFSDLGLILTNSYSYEKGSIETDPGVTLFGTMTFDPQSNVAKIIPGINQLKVRMLLTPEIVGSTLAGTWPVHVPMAPGITTTDVTIKLKVPKKQYWNMGPTVVIESGLTIEQSDAAPLEFRTTWTMGVSDVRITGALNGTWKNALGISGVELADVGIDGTINYVTTTTGVPLTRLGLRGVLALGSKRVELAGLVGLGADAPLGDLILSGKLDGGLHLSDIVALVPAKIPLKNIPNIGLQNITVYLAAGDATIAQKQYYAGLMLSGIMDIAHAQAHMDVHVLSSGIRGYGYVSEINWGPLTITGAGPDTVMETPDDGAIVNLQLDADKQEFFIDGMAQLEMLGVAVGAHTRVGLQLNGFQYLVEQELFNTTWGFDVFAPWSTPDKMFVKAQMTQGSLDTFASLLHTAAQAVVDSAAANIAQEKKRVQNEIQKLDARINRKEKQCTNGDIGSCLQIGSLNVSRLGFQTHDQVLLEIGLFGSKAVAGFANALASVGQNAANLQEVSFAAYASDLAAGRMPQVRVRGIILGMHFDQMLQLDLSDIPKSAVTVIDTISNLF